MKRTKKILNEMATQYGVHFTVMFPIEDGVEIGSTFETVGANEDKRWIVARIDSVVVNGDKIVVVGSAIRDN